MPRSAVLAVAGWLAVAVAATATGVAALAVIGQGLTGPDRSGPMSGAEVASALASPAPSTARPAPTVPPPAPSTTPPTATLGVTKTLTSRGGTVIARCRGGQVTLVSWSPAQGYAVGETERESDGAKVRFERGDRRVEVRVRCGPDGPYAEVRQD